jgi:hypothetical protein
MAAFGYTLELADVDSDAELQKISEDPRKWKIGVGFALIEHTSIIALAVLLFVALNPFNLMLGAILILSRTVEGLLQFYNEKSYWGLLNIAGEYSGAIDAEKEALSDSAHTILKTKEHRFGYTMVFWSIGTLAFSFMLVFYGVLPQVIAIGWLGIVASVLVGLSNGVRVANPNFKTFAIVGLLGIVFEIAIGGWLLFFAAI